MPNFDGTRDTRWGHTTDEIIDALAVSIREVSPTAPVTLIIHDWGAMWGHLLHQRHPELVRRVRRPRHRPSRSARHRSGPRHPRLPVLAGGCVLRRRFVRRLDDPPDGMGHERSRSALTHHRLDELPLPQPLRRHGRGRAAHYFEDYWPETPLLFVYGKRKPFPFPLGGVDRARRAHRRPCGRTSTATTGSCWTPRSTSSSSPGWKHPAAERPVPRR